MTEEKLKPIILLDSDESHGYYHLVGRVLEGTIKYGGVECVQNAIDEWFYDLQIDVQGDLAISEEWLESEPERKWRLYGWDLRFHNCYSLTLGDLRKKARGLGRIERKLRKMEDEEGPCQEFWQYLNRVARAFGAEIIIRTESRGCNYSDNDYRVVAPTDLPEQVRSMQAKHLGEEAA